MSGRCPVRTRATNPYAIGMSSQGWSNRIADNAMITTAPATKRADKLVDGIREREQLAGAHDFLAGSKVPSKCQNPVKSLNGPPTIWLAHSRTNLRVFESYVPLTAFVRPGFDPSGFGEPWLKFWLFQDASSAFKSPLSFPPFTVIFGFGTDCLVCGSVLLVRARPASSAIRTISAYRRTRKGD